MPPDLPQSYSFENPSAFIAALTESGPPLSMPAPAIEPARVVDVAPARIEYGCGAADASAREVLRGVEVVVDLLRLVDLALDPVGDRVEGIEHLRCDSALVEPVVQRAAQLRAQEQRR